MNKGDTGFSATAHARTEDNGVTVVGRGRGRFDLYEGWAAPGFDYPSFRVEVLRAQTPEALESVLAEVKAVEGVTGVTRTVCGGCLDFKVSTSLSADKFGDWEEKKFSPEADFLKKLEGIDGISMIETQTFTIMPM